MSIKEKLLEYVAEKSVGLDLDRLPDDLTAQFMGQMFGVRRNTVSFYLNQAVEEGRLAKIESRPVYFFDKEVFEREHYPLSTNSFPSVRAIKEEQRTKAGGERGAENEKKNETESGKTNGKKNERESGTEPLLDTSAFSELIGYDKSLNMLLRKVKASVLYPGNSLPLMIHGASGVGKSYLAKIIYRFCRDNGVIARDAPFVVFNCSQYANNPELMSSKLFGHVKGAYTGAASDRTGIIDKAEGGILFLDEAHRLSKENQEKLFTVLDEGKFSRIGESEREHRANVRMILATTEDLHSSFLETFRRRIPITIYIPQLSERSAGEKEQMIYSFFIFECRLLKKDICIPRYIFDILLHHRYKANVGELQAAIKYICASAYSRSRGKPHITVSYWDFGEDFLRPGEDMLEVGERKDNPIWIREDSTPESLMESGNIRQFLESTLKNLVEIRTGQWPSVNPQEMDRAMAEQVGYFVSFFSRQFFLMYSDQEEKTAKDGLWTMVAGWLSDNRILKGRGVGETVSQVFSRYLYFRYYHLKELEGLDTEPVRELLGYCSDKFPEESSLTREFTRYFQERLQIPFCAADKLIFILYLKRCGVQMVTNRIYPLIVGHGMTAATSMAELANSYAPGIKLFDALDIWKEESAEQICERIQELLRGREQYGSLLLLWDTDIPAEMEGLVERGLDMETLMLSRICAGDVLDIGRLLEKGKTLTEISQSVRSFPERRNQIINCGKRQLPVIVCSCFSGIATAMRMEHILRASMPEDVNLEIVSCGFAELKAEGRQHEIFRRYHVIGVVGTADPGIDGVDYVPLEDMIIQPGNEEFRRMLLSAVTQEQADRILNELLCNFSVEQLIDTLSILDTKKTIKNIENCIMRYEGLVRRTLTGRMKTCLYIHISCLLERLIRQVPVDSFQGLEKFKQTKQKEIHLIRQAFGSLEEIYHVQIPMEEIGYIYNILYDDEL